MITNGLEVHKLTDVTNFINNAIKNPNDFEVYGLKQVFSEYLEKADIVRSGREFNENYLTHFSDEMAVTILDGCTNSVMAEVDYKDGTDYVAIKGVFVTDNGIVVMYAHPFLTDEDEPDTLFNSDYIDENTTYYYRIN